MPEYSKLGEKIASDPKLKNRVLIAKVDADAHRELGALRLLQPSAAVMSLFIQLGAGSA